MHTACIGIGANLGKPLEQCQMALELIKKIPETRLTVASSFYSSKPLLPEGAASEGIPLFVNAVCKIKTAFSPNALLGHLKRIEKEVGRKNRGKWASREMDLDVLFFDREIIQTETLEIPHPELHRRGFVLKPMNEIAPDWIHPVLGKTVAEMLESL
ncbi:MAG: 2-amino-4-hydroxy-6-hydroxymethyldihydropteridine diphosphokinase, partial [Deltaproteobacteria bacterium]|nr:2-amino-4-hydroxy-6-hydroxymethyldihydropteridine diphosphokinase [Deltaproteobacteria bacterium]